MEEIKTTIGGMPIPAFYPSVSSVSKNVWGVVDHIEILVAANFPQFLVSCFDIYNEKNDPRLRVALEKANEQSQVILYDSGIYEVVWSKSTQWDRNKYLSTLLENEVSHAFCLDDYVVTGKEMVSADLLIDDISSTSKHLGKEIISPIIHCTNITEYIDVCLEISKRSHPRLLAIPERELGFGVVDVAKNIAQLRKALNTLDVYQEIHILGTGNPISMMVYAFVGADSFDGLDWCQTIVDYDSGTLHHTLHFDLHAHKGRWNNEQDMSFLAKCFMHNLDFYKIWMDKLREAIYSEQRASMIEEYISGPQKDVLLELTRN
jgi:hypothetical protein